MVKKTTLNEIEKEFKKEVTKKIKIYSESVLKAATQTLRRDILNADIMLPEFKKEIKRVFQIANRRIQNIEKSGVISTAYEALDIDKDNPRFSKFSISGKNWTDLKIEYAKAVEFLRKPTSTAQGAKQYVKHLQNKTGLDDYQIKMVMNEMKKQSFGGFQQKIFPISSNKLETAASEFYREINSVSNELENAAKDNDNLIELSAKLDKDIKETFGVSMTETEKNELLNNFKNFGL